MRHVRTKDLPADKTFADMLSAAGIEYTVEQLKGPWESNETAYGYTYKSPVAGARMYALEYIKGPAWGDDSGELSTVWYFNVDE